MYLYLLEFKPKAQIRNSVINFEIRGNRFSSRPDSPPPSISLSDGDILLPTSTLVASVYQQITSSM